MQRTLDILIAASALIVLMPLLIFVSVVLKLSGEGEILYLQERVGFMGKTFRLVKFATMLKSSPEIGTGTITIKNDPRVLPVGRILRKTKINELPQLFNVLFGEMSVVGPRPQAKTCFDAFPADLQKVLVRVKPGLSGLGPIIFRAEEDILAGQNGSVNFYNYTLAPYKGYVEAWYVERPTMANYFKVIAVTVWVVLLPRSGIVWSVFKGLPQPPEELKTALNYPLD